MMKMKCMAPWMLKKRPFYLIYPHLPCFPFYSLDTQIFLITAMHQVIFLGILMQRPRYLAIKPGEGCEQSPGNQRVYYLILQITGLLMNISSEHIKQAHPPGNGLLQTETYIYPGTEQTTEAYAM